MIINGIDFNRKFEELRDRLNNKIEEIYRDNLVIVFKNGNFHKVYCRGEELKLITKLEYYLEYDSIPMVNLTILKPRIIEL